MDLQEVGWGGMNWFAVAQDRDRWRLLVHAVSEALGFIKCEESLGQLRTCTPLRMDCMVLVVGWLVS